jgi:hypothetical protein
LFQCRNPEMNLGAVSFGGEKSLPNEGIDVGGHYPWLIQDVSIQSKFLVFVEDLVVGEIRMHFVDARFNVGTGT